MEADLKTQIQELEKEAFSRYNAGRFPEAQQVLKQILQIDPKHSLARFYIDKIARQQKAASLPKENPPAEAEYLPDPKTPINPTTRISREDAMSKTATVFRKCPEDTVVYVASTKRLTKEDVLKDISGVEGTKKYSAPAAPKAEGKKTPGAIKVMVVDDSSLMRKVIRRILEKSPAIKVVGEATNGEELLAMIPTTSPDLITLDVNMPVMDGVTALKHILVGYDIPVIMLSAYTEEGAVTTFDCLTYGAVDFICKPSREGGSLIGKEDEIVQKVTRASQLQIKTLRKARSPKREEKRDLSARPNAGKIIVIGAGDGGYSGFLKILPHLPEQLPCAILAVQYMEDQYFEAFHNYLDRHSRIWVKKAEDKELIKEGVCYLVNQKVYLKIQSGTEGYRCQVAKKPEFLAQQNVFNHLLFSAAETYGPNTIGVVLAGKGIDGLEGIRELKRVRGITLAQDPAGCITPQLCEITINSGSIDRVVDDADFPGVLWHLVKTVKPNS